MQNTSEQHEPGDPAQAFEDLRAEVSVLRRAVEALPHAWADNRPPDYKADLGELSKRLGAAMILLDRIEKHPALKLTPEQHQQAVAHAGNALMREALQKLDHATQEADRERQRLAAMIGSARTQDRQFRAQCWAAGIALIVGLILSPLVAGVLPFGLDERVAALVLKEDRWSAGLRLMQSGNPDSWRGVVDSTNLVRSNQEALSGCRELATRTRKAQRCTITVAP